MSKVKLTTSLGDIILELDAAKAPLSVENFLKYVNKGHYNNTLFHRVNPSLMIQGGGYEPGMRQKPTSYGLIQNEANNGLTNAKYTVAMARTSDPHSAEAQFFINVANNTFLDYTSPTPQGWGYAVFGRVTEGQEVVDQIGKVKIGRKGGNSEAPVTDVVIQKAQVIG